MFVTMSTLVLASVLPLAVALLTPQSLRAPSTSFKPLLCAANDLLATHKASPLITTAQRFSAGMIGLFISASACVPLVHADSGEYLKSLATVIETKEVLKPVMGYVKDQAYDNARTNIKVPDLHS